jgi:membrane protease subunit HflK
MLTGDENIVDAEVIVQYKIKDAGDYLFNVKDPEGTLRDAAEASIRLVIGQNTIERVLTVGKHEIQEQIATMLQDVMDRYDSGILITAVKLQDVSAPKPVIAAFKDVASAREDKNRLINQAKGYQEDVIPKARGEAERIIREAEAYKEKRIREAEGEAARFRKILQEYRKAKLVTKKRLYLETMEGILPHIRKVVIDKRSGNILNLLPIDKILSKELGGETR